MFQSQHVVQGCTKVKDPKIKYIKNNKVHSAPDSPAAAPPVNHLSCCKRKSGILLIVRPCTGNIICRLTFGTEKGRNNWLSVNYRLIRWLRFLISRSNVISCSLSSVGWLFTGDYCALSKGSGGDAAKRQDLNLSGTSTEKRRLAACGGCPSHLICIQVSTFVELLNSITSRMPACKGACILKKPGQQPPRPSSACPILDPKSERRRNGLLRRAEPPRKTERVCSAARRRSRSFQSKLYYLV